VRTCVIFNPTARGEKASRFRRHLGEFAADCVFKPTTAPGVGRTLATEAVSEGFDTIVAAGGDGTINEVLNGIGDFPDGFKKARLAVLPLGTVNVFAKELRLPLKLDRAWKVIQQDRERRIDLPRVEFQKDGKPARQYFAQLAGTGLDARAIELVSWKLKKQAGPLAYVAAGLGAMKEAQPKIEMTRGGQIESGQLVLVGNGRYYGGKFQIFPGADLADGLLDVCVFPRVSWDVLFHCGATLLTTGKLPGGRARHFRTASFQLAGPPGTAFEVDGDLCGQLPAAFSIEPLALRVVVP
jgi:diacylglycerol kinase (ATP)